ncbi:MAG: hypothetical protein KatS3mg035_0090 [Bacteroidia bacterium]|nr:MAG: hypothetical protein KatS3mg035_0090 [Bacteroidia bacterium]
MTEWGWDIDFIKPLSKKGTISIKNIRPMHWKNILSKGENYPSYLSAVTANGNWNIDFEIIFNISKKI